MDCADSATGGAPEVRPGEGRYETCHDQLQAAISRVGNWTFGGPDGINSPTKPSNGSKYETVSAEILHVVERDDLRDEPVDVAIRRTGRYRRAGQQILPHQGRQDRSDAGLRAPLGDLQRLCRSQHDPAGLAWLDPPHRGRTADRRELCTARMAEAAPAEPARYAGSPPPGWFDCAQRPS